MGCKVKYKVNYLALVQFAIVLGLCLYFYSWALFVIVLLSAAKIEATRK